MAPLSPQNRYRTAGFESALKNDGLEGSQRGQNFLKNSLFL